MAGKLRKRCAWAEGDPLMQAYHDEEWGVPERDGRALWEKLMLDGFQAGLSWSTILKKREAFRQAFAHFDPERVARFTERDVVRLLANPGIVRSRQNRGHDRRRPSLSGDGRSGRGFFGLRLEHGRRRTDSQQKSHRAGQDTSLGGNVQGPQAAQDSNSSARSSSMLGCRRPAR